MHGRGCTDEFEVAVVVLGENPMQKETGIQVNLVWILKTVLPWKTSGQNPDIPIGSLVSEDFLIGDQIDDWAGLVAAWLLVPKVQELPMSCLVIMISQVQLLTWPWYIDQFPMPVDSSEALFPIGFGLTKNEDRPVPERPEIPLPEGHDISERLEAEDAFRAKSLQTENTSDEGGGLNVGWTEAGQWYDYVIDVPEDGLYDISFRVAASNGGSYPAFQVLNQDGEPIGEPLNIPDTGGWQNWRTLKNTVALYEGVQIIRINVLNGNWNINWMEFERAGDIPENWRVAGNEPRQINIPSSPTIRKNAVEVWFSSENNAGKAWYYSPQEIRYRLEKQNNLDLVVPTDDWDVETITVDPDTEYQEILGIGTSMEESTVYNLSKLSPEVRTDILRKLVAKDEANMSLIRVTIGTADFTGKEFYTYADIPYDQVPQEKTLSTT